MNDDDLNYNIKAVLGPTNTGKTYYAFDRMLSYKSGVFGFPLRLLARENYDKAVDKLGKNKIALITGEEKIIPEKSKYFFCTVESMPKNKEFEFLAIDEIQLTADFERGHIFTDRLLNYRGIYETIFIGSTTISKILKKLFPKIKIESRKRFSKLSFTKRLNISKLKPRTAVIAFNLNDVYSIAETLRSQKGGAAVVLGALSPRTRNSQVEMYENKNVDYLVATDAIGMGLNLNIEHIAFSSLKKFDGNFLRKLKLSEIGQIAGRAGRYTKDGTFGLTKEAEDLDPLSIETIENHQFESIKKIYWRNSKIDFSSVSSVLNSLNQNSNLDILIKKRNAEDEKFFKFLSNDIKIKHYLNSSANIKILWDVCRIPDFRKLIIENHIEFLKSVFLNLKLNNNYLENSWIRENVNRLNNINGDIDTLSKRIAYIRTWTYISNHANWIKNKTYWQENTRKIEDRLSDELHKKLKFRFVDQQGTYFIDKIKKGNNLDISIKNNNVVEMEGSSIGIIEGFNLRLYKDSEKNNSNIYINAAKKSVLKMIPVRIKSLLNAPDDAFGFGEVSKLTMDQPVNIFWGNDIIGYISKGNNAFLPKVNILNTELLENSEKEKILKKVQQWLNDKIDKVLQPISKDTNNISKFSSVRSVMYNLFNDMGCSHKLNFSSLSQKLTLEEKKDFSKLGIRTGIDFFYFPSFLKKNAIELRALLWKTYNLYNKKQLFPLPNDGRVFFQINFKMPESYWLAIGYIKVNNLAIRVDIIERLFFMVRQKNRLGVFIANAELMNLVGCNSEQLKEILFFLGYDSIIMGNDQLLFIQKEIPKKKKINNNKKSKNINSDSPFAVLGSYFNK